MKFKGRIAIVTGRANGIGRATSLRLANEGAEVVIADLEIGSAKKVADEIYGIGSESIGHGSGCGQE